MALEFDRSILGKEFDAVEYGPITAEELITFAETLGETAPEYTRSGPALVAHPTFCVRVRTRRFYPDTIPGAVNARMGFDAGKDIELGVPVRPGDRLTVRSTLHDVYEKTGRTGSMYFVVIRSTLTNQRGERVAVIDNRFMHR